MIPLKKNDVIGIFSPSSPVTHTNPIRFKRAKEYLENKGFRVLEGQLTGKKDFYRSGSIQERASELNALIRNPEVRCIMSTIGGLNSNSLLPYIDYEAFKRDPKIIVGFSDVTAILLGIYAQTGITTFYGPACVATFGEFPPFVDLSFEYFQQTLINPPVFPFQLKNPPVWTEERIDWETQDRAKQPNHNQLITITQGISQGRLIGGNLNTMQGIWGSPYMPEIKQGDILFIEDSWKNASTIERSFALLKINGVFERISGLILGKHEQFDNCHSQRKPYEILLEVLGGVPSFPFLAEVDCGHTFPMFTLPIGCDIELNATLQHLTIMKPYF